jgi:hypothetical protein
VYVEPLPPLGGIRSSKQHIFFTIKSNTAGRVFVVGAGLEDVQNVTRQLRSTSLRSRAFWMAHRSVAIL